MSSLATDQRSRTARFPSPAWWVQDRHGKVVIAQPPNAPIIVWLLASAASWTGLTDDHQEAVLTRVGQGALAAWALDEILRGASPVRRLFGAVALPVVVWRIFH